MSSGYGTRQLAMFSLGQIKFFYQGISLEFAGFPVGKHSMLCTCFTGTNCVAKALGFLTVTSYHSGIPLFNEVSDWTLGTLTTLEKGKQDSLKLRQTLDVERELSYAQHTKQ